MKSNNDSKIKMLLKILAILHNFFLISLDMYLCTFQCWWNNYQELKGDNNENRLKHVQETKIV